MTAGNSSSGETRFAERFDQLVPLIRDEWPQVDGDALAQTKGDYELVVALIATETEHSKALVKKQLDEISQVAHTNGEGHHDEVKRLRLMVERLQHKSQDVANYVRKQMLGEARDKVGQNPLVALLMAVGLGIILGFVLRGLGRERR
jgi:ElaB/YqjD/DUF883 family membrane-anchored ribosome-binding protein